MTDSAPWAAIYINAFVTGVSSWSGDLMDVFDVALDQGYFVRKIFVRDPGHPDAFERMLTVVREDDRFAAVFTPGLIHIDEYTGRRTQLITQVADLIAAHPPHITPKVAL
ncbi:hypothetical protein [Nocardia sp. NPDC057030]|uniref:hypothetical protein n=1 Tax=unclassified Nocardia TaxID=2637762 RepID=UPI00363C9853